MIALSKGDLLEWGDSNIRFRGLQDGTLNLILRHRFEEEILHHEPNMIGDFNAELATLTKENQVLGGKLNHIKEQLTEVQFANTLRSRKRFRLADFFEGANDDQPLNLLDVQTRVMLQRPDGGKKEVDIVAQASDERVLLVDVKNQQEKPNHETVEDFLEKAALYQSQNPGKTLLLAFLSLGGFTEQALELCRQQGIAWTTELEYFKYVIHLTYLTRKARRSIRQLTLPISFPYHPIPNLIYSPIKISMSRLLSAIAKG